MTKRQYLAVPSVDDSRDFVATMIAPTLATFPENFRIPYNGEVKNQGQVGSCVAHSASYCREIVEEKQSGVYKKFSVGFVYANREATDSQSEGMMPREMLRNLQTYGDVLYEDFPYNEAYPTVKQLLDPLKVTLYPKAYQYRISAYSRLRDTDEVKSALMQLGPVTICMPVYPQFETLNSVNAIVAIPNESVDKLIGYHEVTIVGWIVINNVEYWVVLNSWGKEWGVDGYFYLPFDFPIAEAWSITDSILPQPSPEPETHKFYRVQSKTYKVKTTAVRLMHKAIALGYKAALDKIDNQYIVQVGAFTEAEQDKANALLSDVNSKLSYANFQVRYY